MNLVFDLLRGDDKDVKKFIEQVIRNKNEFIELGETLLLIRKRVDVE